MKSILPLAVSVLVVTGAQAQMQLPGAAAPTPSGAVVTPGGPSAPKKARREGPPPPPKLPKSETLVGRTLQRNGRDGTLQFALDGKDLRIAKLSMAGEKISAPGEVCAVDAPGAPLTPAPAGKPHGVDAYNVSVEGCAFSFDVLDGAVLVSTDGKACDFKAADCRTDPTGMWGQPAIEIGVNRAKEIERARITAEKTMRADFRAWTEQAKKDHPLVKRLAHDQAGFSAKRSEVCDSYARETDHGYCSLLMTQARVLALGARVQPAEEAIAEPDPLSVKRKRRGH